MTESYGLPAGYKINPINITIDQGDRFYWDPKRLIASSKYQFAVYAWAADLIQKKKLPVVADVGCGLAPKLAWLHQKFPDQEFWGIDQPNAIALCKKNYAFGNWLGVDFERDPVSPPVRASLSISSDVIEHLENPDVLLDYLRKITAPGGYILISTPERNALRGKGCMSSGNAYHVREWTKEEFANYLESRNFKILEHRILPAIRYDLSPFCIKAVLPRWLSGKTMRFNQAALVQV
jgi:trans-aconitate methyltransferase